MSKRLEKVPEQPETEDQVQSMADVQEISEDELSEAVGGTYQTKGKVQMDDLVYRTGSGSSSKKTSGVKITKL